MSPYLGFIFMCSWMYDISLCFDNLTQFHIHDMIISIKIFFIIFTYIHYIQFLKNFQKLHIMVFLYIFFFHKNILPYEYKSFKKFQKLISQKNRLIIFLNFLKHLNSYDRWFSIKFFYIFLRTFIISKLFQFFKFNVCRLISIIFFS